jgi:hypothetical protein
MILDCSSPCSTQLSLGQILNLSSTHLREALSRFDLDQFYSEHQSDERKPGVIILEEVLNFASDTRVAEDILWFHGTRVIDPESFRVNGIRPLNYQLDQIWTDLFNVAGHLYVGRQGWDDFRRGVETDYRGRFADLYRMKTRDALHWGPHAVLIRDVLINPQRFGSVNYLNTPEIVEDICTCFCEQTGRNLLRVFQEQSRACIVHFNDDTPRADAIPIALHYLYQTNRGNDLFPGCNTCFDGHTEPIQPQQIVAIDVISQ